MPQYFLCIKKTISLRESAKYSSRKATDNPICETRNGVWFMEINRDFHYPSSNGDGEWDKSSFGENSGWFFSEENSSRLDNSDDFLNGEKESYEREISAKFPANNRGKGDSVFCCDTRFDTWWFADPVELDLFVILGLDPSIQVN